MMSAIADTVALHVADHVPCGVHAGMRRPHGAGARKTLGGMADGGHADDDEHRGDDDREEDHGAFEERVHFRRSFLHALALTARSCCLQCLSFSGMALLWRLRGLPVFGLSSCSFACCSRWVRSCCSRGPIFDVVMIVLLEHEEMAMRIEVAQGCASSEVR